MPGGGGGVPVSSASPHLFAASIIKPAAHTSEGSGEAPVGVFLELRRINYECGADVFSPVAVKASGPGWISFPSSPVKSPNLPSLSPLLKKKKKKSLECR